MLIEILGVDDVNKGGELMMHSVLDQLGDIADVALGHWAGPYQKRARLGTYQKVWIRRLGRYGGMPGRAVPRAVRRKYGLVTDDDVEVFLDASGFGYTDFWGPGPIETAAALARARARRGKPTIVLPQAFGPFDSRRSRAAVRGLLEASALVYARDPTSLEHLRAAGGAASDVRLCPDFTNLLVPKIRPDLLPVAADRACAIIPNYRMVDKQGARSRDAYESFLAHCIERATDAGLDPFFLIHETDLDAELAEAVSRRVRRSIPMLRHDDPIAIKGAIGACALVVGSRFHGLVSALSQGIPALGSGWSHKYASLFEDYGFLEEGLIVDVSDVGEVDAKLMPLLDESRRRAVRVRLMEHSERQKRLVEAMWRDVRAVMAVNSGRGAN